MPRQGIAPAPRRITAGICAPCGRGRYRFHASFRQARVLAFWRLGFRQCGFHHIARISRHSVPYASATATGFLACYCPRFPFGITGQPSDPKTPPPVHAHYAGYIAVRLVAHTDHPVRPGADGVPGNRVWRARDYYGGSARGYQPAEQSSRLYVYASPRSG